MELMGHRVAKPDLLAVWIRECENENGGFGLIPRMPSELPPTYWAAGSFRSLGLHLFQPVSCRDWITSCKGEGGGFRRSPETEEKPEIWYTYCAVNVISLIAKYGTNIA
jgi:hypothetical protein